MFDRIAAYQPHLLSVLRIMSGLLFLQHGTAKVLGFPAVEGVPPPGLSLAGLSGPLELILGLLLVLGLFSRPAAFLASGFCAVGYWAIHSERRGVDRPLLFRLPVSGGRRRRAVEPGRGHAQEALRLTDPHARH